MDNIIKYIRYKWACWFLIEVWIERNEYEGVSYLIIQCHKYLYYAESLNKKEALNECKQHIKQQIYGK